MVVGKRFDARQQSWQVQWRCNGKHSIRVRVNALNGDTAAAERVARLLQEQIEAASDRSDSARFLLRLDELILAELADRCFVEAATVVDSDATTSLETTCNTSVVVSGAASSTTAGAWGICPMLIPFPVLPSGPTSLAVHMKATHEVFVTETAAGHKFWECTIQSGMFNRVRAGDLLVLTQTGAKGLVVTVGEIANMAIRRETRRAVLYERIPSHLRKAVDEYLREATAFDYVQFTQVFDMRRCRMRYTDILAQGLFEDPCLPWCNGLLTARKTPASSMVGLRDFLATHGARRVCQDGIDVD